MTQIQLSKLWLFVSAVLLYYSVNTWIVTQGGNEIFDAKLVVSDKVPAALTAIPICAVLLSISSSVALLFSARSGKKWHERVPLAAFEQLVTGSREGRVYQATMLVLFSALPIFALIHFWCTIMAANVMQNDGTKKLIGSAWDWSGLTSFNDPARICTSFNLQLSDPCIGNATILPGIQPAFFAVLTGAAVLLTVAHWLRVTIR